MPRFLLHVAAGSIGAGIFYAVMPMALAMSLNATFPYGLDAINGSFEIKVFACICVATILPMTIVAATRSGRRIFFGATDCRPAMFGQAGNGLNAARSYGRRIFIGLAVGVSAFIAALALAYMSSSSVAVRGMPLLVPYLSLLCITGLLTAIEQNDLRRTVNLGLLGSDA